MFKKFTKSLTMKTLDVVKESVKDEVDKKTTSTLPFIFLGGTILATMLSLAEPTAKKAPSIVINIQNLYL